MILKFSILHVPKFCEFMILNACETHKLLFHLILLQLWLIHITKSSKCTPKHPEMFFKIYFSIELNTMKMGKWKKIEAKREPYVLILATHIFYGCLSLVFSGMLIHSVNLWWVEIEGRY